MKLYMKRITVFVIAVTMVLFAFTGCSYSAENGNGNTTAIIIDGQKYSIEEAKLYTYAGQYDIEANNSIYILYYYNANYDTFWESNWGSALGSAVTIMNQTKLLVKYAKENGITLSEEEQAKVAKAIEDFKTGARSVAIRYSGASDELIERYFTENAIANKVYLELVKDVDTALDYETFRHKRVEGLSVKANETVKTFEEEADEPAEEAEDEETGIPEEEADLAEDEASGEAEDETEAEAEEETEAEAEEETEAEAEVEEETEAEAEEETETEAGDETEEEPTTEEPISEEDQEKYRENALKQVKAHLELGETPDEIVELFAKDPYVTVSSLGTLNLASENAAPEGEEPDEYKELGWSLKTGDIVTATYVAENGSTLGYALHCISDDDEEYRKSAEDAEMKDRKDKLFGEHYEEIVKNAGEFYLYTDRWSKYITYKGAIKKDISITGDDMANFEDENPVDEEEAGEEE